MGSKPKAYQPSAEEQALQASQLEEMRRKDSEIAESKYRRKKGARKRSLVSHMEGASQAAAAPNQTLGATGAVGG